MNLFQRITFLLEKTTSDDIKEMCNKLLNESKESSLEDVNITSFLNEASLLSSKDEDVKNLENEVKNFLHESESPSKKYAEMLSKSWKGLNENKIQTSGTWVNKEEPKKSEFLNESEINNSENIYEDFNVLDSLNKIKGTSIYSHGPIKIVVENYNNLLTNKRLPEYTVIGNLCNELKNFIWDNDIKEVYESLSKIIKDNHREIEVKNTIRNIKNSSGKDFYSGIIDQLNEWLKTDEKSNAILLKEVGKWAFNPHIKNLINYISVQENSNVNKFEVINGNKHSDVSLLHSPVCVLDESIIFNIGQKYFTKKGDIVRPLTEAEYSLLSVEYKNLVESFISPNVKVDGNSVNYYVGKNKISLVHESNESSFYLNSIKIPNKNLLSALNIELTGSFGVNENTVIKDIMTLANGLDKIMEIDFAKSIKSKVYEGVYSNIMKTNKGIFIQRVNESMRENSFFLTNGTQAVKMIKDFLGFDLSESLSSFLIDDEKIKNELLKTRDLILNNISIVEGEINKINKFLENNPKLIESPEISSAKNLLEKDLLALQNKWGNTKATLKRFENDVTEISNISEDYRFNIGDSVKIKESGEMGKIISIDGFSGTYTVLLERGLVRELNYNDVDSISSIGKGNENEEGDLKEGKKTPEKVLTDNTEKAPGGKAKDTKSEISKKMEDAANLEEAPKGNNKKPEAEVDAKDSEMKEAPEGKKTDTKFKVKGTDQGYNLK